MSRREFSLGELRKFQTDARREAHHFQKMLMNAYDVDGLATQLLESRAALAAADLRCREAKEQAERVAAALRFYAEEKHYDYRPVESTDHYARFQSHRNGDMEVYLIDDGEIARAALVATEK